MAKLFDWLVAGKETLADLSIQTGTLNISQETIQYTDKVVRDMDVILRNGESLLQKLADTPEQYQRVSKIIDKAIGILKESQEIISHNMEEIGLNKDDEISHSFTYTITGKQATKLRDVYDNAEQMLSSLAGKDGAIIKMLKTDKPEDRYMLLNEIEARVSTADVRLHDSIAFNKYQQDTVVRKPVTLSPEAANRMYKWSKDSYTALISDGHISATFRWREIVQANENPEPSIIKTVTEMRDYQNTYKLPSDARKDVEFITAYSKALRDVVNKIEDKYDISITAQTVRENITKNNHLVQDVCAEMMTSGSKVSEIPLENGNKAYVVISNNPEAKTPYMVFQTNSHGEVVPRTVNTFEQASQLSAYICTSVSEIEKVSSEADWVVKTLMDADTQEPLMATPSICGMDMVQQSVLLNTENYLSAYNDLSVAITGGRTSDGIKMQGVLLKDTDYVKANYSQEFNKIVKELTESSVSLADNTSYASVNITMRKDENEEPHFDTALLTNRGEKIVVSYDKDMKVEEIYVQKPEPIPPEKNPFKKFINAVFHRETPTIEKLSIDPPKGTDIRDGMTKIFDMEHGILTGYNNVAHDSNVRGMLENFSTLIKANEEFERNELTKTNEDNNRNDIDFEGEK